MLIQLACCGAPYTSTLDCAMAAACPNCHRSLRWWTLESAFTCPHCAAELSAKTTGAYIATIIVWIVLDFPVKFLMFALTGTDGVSALIARIIASGLVGWGLASLMVGSLSTVTVQNAR